MYGTEIPTAKNHRNTAKSVAVKLIDRRSSQSPQKNERSCVSALRKHVNERSKQQYAASTSNLQTSCTCREMDSLGQN